MPPPETDYANKTNRRSNMAKQAMSGKYPALRFAPSAEAERLVAAQGLGNPMLQCRNASTSPHHALKNG